MLKKKKMLILLLIGAYPIYLLVMSIFLVLLGEKTTGTVLETVSNGGKSNGTVTCLVEYKDINGHSIRFRGMTKNIYLTSSKISVIYLEKFNISKIDDPWRIWGIPILLNLFFLWIIVSYDKFKIEERVNIFLFGEQKKQD